MKIIILRRDVLYLHKCTLVIIINKCMRFLFKNIIFNYTLIATFFPEYLGTHFSKKL